MSLSSRMALIVLAGALWTIGAAGQSPPRAASPTNAIVSAAGSVPPAGDPTVLWMFLRYHDSLIQDVKTLSLTNTTAAQNRQSGAAASMNLAVVDFTRVSSVYQQLTSLLQVVDTDANAYRDAVSSGKQVLDINALKQFSARREQAIANARVQLQQTLTPAGWQALSAYIDGQFRQAIVRTP